jgi:hypothetical protein
MIKQRLTVHVLFDEFLRWTLEYTATTCDLSLQWDRMSDLCFFFFFFFFTLVELV